jgi:hypothetical protein
MIKSTIHPITGQSFQCNDTPLFVITVVVFFIVKTMSIIAQTTRSIYLKSYRLWFARFRYRTSPRVCQKIHRSLDNFSFNKLNSKNHEKIHIYAYRIACSSNNRCSGYSFG